MEVNVRQQRADNSPLRRPLPCLDQASLFKHTCIQPLGDQPNDPPVANPVLNETDQPFPADLVEKGLNVAVEYPVDPLPANSVCERIQRLVLVAPRTEPVAEPQELRLVYWRQDSNHRSLDDLILQACDAQRPLSAIGFRNISPARWQRSIRSCVDPAVEISRFPDERLLRMPGSPTTRGRIVSRV